MEGFWCYELEWGAYIRRGLFSQFFKVYKMRHYHLNCKGKIYYYYY